MMNWRSVMAGVRRKRPLIPTLTALLFFALCVSGCGKASDTSGLAGTWILQAVNNDTVSVSESVVAENRIVLRLDPDGSGKLLREGNEGRITWAYDESVLAVNAGSVSLTGSVEGNEIILRDRQNDSFLHFVSFSEDQTDDTEAGTDSHPAEDWLGDWYGWWKIEGSDGKMPVSWYDCCASFAEQEDGLVRMTLWDEDGSRSEPLAEISFSVLEDGSLLTENGYFLYADIRKGDWTVSTADHAIYMDDISHATNSAEFHAAVYLLQWGRRWDHAEAEQRPFYYEDWYLPLIEAGESMPDSIPWQELEENRSSPAEKPSEESFDGS